MKIKNVLVLMSVSLVFIVLGCSQQQTQPLIDNNLQISSLSRSYEWSPGRSIDWNVVCDLCNKNSENCEVLNAATLKTKLDYYRAVSCDFSVDGNKINQEGNYGILQGISENPVKLNIKQSHSFTLCCEGICKSASIPALCD